ncbi:hypothetical protein Bbelb_393870 [Branchiostoma belcheri]|nr:hypothetical protein Bbelb_393870 [Branchiostoma belcheri]
MRLVAPIWCPGRAAEIMCSRTRGLCALTTVDNKKEDEDLLHLWIPAKVTAHIRTDPSRGHFECTRRRVTTCVYPMPSLGVFVCAILIDYDFIAHTDTVATDVRLFLKKYNITAKEEILPAQRPRHANSDNVFSDIYAQVPIEEILPVRETFKEDFDMFGYSFDQDLAKILAGKLKG